jgi:anaerobic selenocysteine-containing dehydrogenase
MLTLSETKISTQYHQLQPGSDLAVLVGMSKALLAMDDEAKAAGTGRVIDVDFIEQETSGFDAFVASMDHLHSFVRWHRFAPTGGK